MYSGGHQQALPTSLKTFPLCSHGKVRICKGSTENKDILNWRPQWHHSLPVQDNTVFFPVAIASRSACSQWHKWNHKKSMTAIKKSTVTKFPNICTTKKKRASMITFPLFHPPWEHSRMQASRHSVHVSPSTTPGSSDPPRWAPGRSQSTPLAVDKVTFAQNSAVESVFLSSRRCPPPLKDRDYREALATRVCCNGECEWNDSTDPCSTSETPGELCAPAHSETGNSSGVPGPACAGASCGSGRQMPWERESKEKAATLRFSCLLAWLPACPLDCLPAWLACRAAVTPFSI